MKRLATSVFAASCGVIMSTASCSPGAISALLTQRFSTPCDSPCVIDGSTMSAASILPDASADNISAKFKNVMLTSLSDSPLDSSNETVFIYVPTPGAVTAIVRPLRSAAALMVPLSSNSGRTTRPPHHAPGACLPASATTFSGTLVPTALNSAAAGDEMPPSSWLEAISGSSSAPVAGAAVAVGAVVGTAAGAGVVE